MSRCNEIRPLLDDWLDNLLDTAEREQVDAHLRTCDTCRGEFERHAAIAGDLATLGAFADEIASRKLAHRLASRQWFGLAARWRSSLAAAAVIILCLSLTIAEFRQTPNAPTPTTRESPGGSGPMTPPVTASSFSITAPADMLAVPCESSNPRIHIVWLYDEVRPAETSTQDETDPNSNPPA